MKRKFSLFLEGNWANLNYFFILAGLVAAFLLFFISPVFLNSDRVMKFPEYVPMANPVGLDLNYVLEYCDSWLIKHNTPYIGLNLYPPLAMLLFSPLLILSQPHAFAMVTGITLLAYVFAALLLPLMTKPSGRDFSVTGLIFVMGLFSYGFHFEIEKGQFNLIAFSLASLGVYLFHKQPKHRYAAYILLTIATQLKVYPAIFALMMIDNWLDWKANLKRFSMLAVSNFLLLFVGGYQVFLDFLQAIQKQMSTPNPAITNHSIKVFAELLFRKIGFQKYFLSAGVSQNQLRDLVHYSWVVEVVLLAVVLLSVLTILVKSQRLNLPASNPYIFLACTIGALIIPAVSNDYKLPLLAGPMAIFMQQPLPHIDGKLRAVLFLGIKFTASIAYALTLFSYTNKPLFLQNNLPVLLWILLAATIMVILEKPSTHSPDKTSAQTDTP